MGFGAMVRAFCMATTHIHQTFISLSIYVLMSFCLNR